MTIEELRTLVAPMCRDFSVSRLYAFGSVARGTSDSTSDIDLLVEFNSPGDHLAKRFFGLLHRLEDTLEGHVDLLTNSGLRNPYFKQRVLSERVPVYEG